MSELNRTTLIKTDLNFNKKIKCSETPGDNNFDNVTTPA